MKSQKEFRKLPLAEKQNEEFCLISQDLFKMNLLENAILQFRYTTIGDGLEHWFHQIHRQIDFYNFF